MRDIPFFATELGVASLHLKEITYRQEAYIKIQDSCQPDDFLQECVSFCRVAGAESVFATGHAVLQKFPLHTEIWTMECAREQLPSTDACLFPVQRTTAEQWREIFNERMRHVPNAATMTINDTDSMLGEGSGYFIHQNGKLLGIGKASGNRMDAIAAVTPGVGKELVCSLANALSCDNVVVEVASANISAVRLYEMLGFIKTNCLSVWHQVL